MAVVIKRLSENGTNTLNYIKGKNGKGHNGHEVRNVVVSAIDCSCDLDEAKQMMQTEWSKPHQSKVQTHHYIQSFEKTELDPKNPDDISRCNELGYQLAQKIIGKGHHMAVIATQIDGKSGLLHNHIVICNQDYQTGKALAGRTASIEIARKKNDTVLKANGMTQPDKLTDEYTANTDLVRKIEDNGGYSWKGDLQRRIEQAQEKSGDWNEFTDNLDELGVTIRAFRKKAYRNGKLIDPSQKMKTITYLFTDNNGKEEKCRATRLGSEYDFNSLEQSFDIVKEMRKDESERLERQNQQRQRAERRVRELAGREINQQIDRLAESGDSIIRETKRQAERQAEQKARQAERARIERERQSRSRRHVVKPAETDEREDEEYRKLAGIDHELTL